MSRINHRRPFAFPGLFLAMVALSLPQLALAQTTGTSRSFDKGSLIIPVDNCYQGDVAQPTPPKALATDGFSWGNSTCAGDGPATSVMANGARRAYGLVWLLLKAGVPIYWIVNSAKKNVDDADLTLSNCAGNFDAATLVDPSLPASYCGLDSLHPVEASVSVSGLPGFPAACTDLNTGGVLPTVGTVPLRSDHTPVGNISYRGGPFVIDAKDASLARDVMAWYFVAPPLAFGGAGPTLPLSAGVYVSPTPQPVLTSIIRPYTNVWNYGDAPGTLGTYGSQYVDPGHHPLHWSDYTPSIMVPFYPALAFGLDIGAHSTVWPCNDACLCPYTTWDPINPNGFVDPWAGTIANGFNAGTFNGSDSQNAITYATVNVHQAQVGFQAEVAKVFDAPMNPIALAAMGDPVHINTFRFYIEEAGLTFGPCKAPPGPWLVAGSTGFASFNPNDPGGQPAGVNDFFFDPTNYPFPSNGVPGPPATFSGLPVTCSEGLNADPNNANDFALMNQIDANANAAGPIAPSPCSPATSCAAFTATTPPPYGQVLDLIAPEPGPIQSLLGTDSNGNKGCGAPTYQELWIPHWDAYLCSSPTTEGCPLAAQSTSTAGAASGSWAALTTTNASPFWTTACSAMVTGVDGFDPYCPQLVQTFMNAVQTYVWKGGNLLAECLGAASLEDYTYERYLGEKGIAQQITHFMTEWTAQGALNDYWPTQAYFPTTPPLLGGNLAEPAGYGNGQPGATQDCIEVATVPCDGLGTPGAPTDKVPGNLCGANPVAALPKILEQPAGLAVGWPGDQVHVGPAAGINNTVRLVADTTGEGKLQFNAFVTGMSQNPMPPPYGPVNSVLCEACNWGGAGVCPPSVGNTCAAACNCATACQCVPTAEDPEHAVYYAPPASIVGAASPSGGGSGPATTLADPFLQIGDFYFEGIYGATESWTQGLQLQGYATSLTTPDTLVLIRGLPANGLDQIDPFMVDSSGNLLYGDYWVKNHNSANSGESGTVVYLQGDSFDGRPDGLRMIWSSMLNLGFLPNEVELARSSGVAFQGSTGDNYHNLLPTPDNYLFQGTFVQAQLPSKYGTIYNTKGDIANFAFPAERGHFRQYDTTADVCLGSTVVGALSTDNNTLASSGNASCVSAVAAGTAGSNTTSFGNLGPDGVDWKYWDTNGPNPTMLLSLTPDVALINDTVDSAGAHPIKDRLIFSHLYQGFAAGVGLRAASLSPKFANAATVAAPSTLTCALFPNAAGCGLAPLSNLVCPDGIGAHCLIGTLQCAACIGNVVPPGLPVAITNGACTDFPSCSTSDVGGLLYDVYNAGGGCVPLLKDTCYPAGDPHVQCLDECWTTCVSNCNPVTNFPPLVCSGAYNVAQCGQDCASHCNATDPAHDHCGANSANAAGDFRETCGPGVGGVDHSTPVIVGPVAAGSVQEGYPQDPTNPTAGAPIPATCRPTVAYFGAADGMLHAIYVDDGPGGAACPDTCAVGQFKPGQELWAFVPNQQLPLLRTNGNCAQSLFVDGVPTAKDVYADLGDGRGLQWHTVLTETEGAGGNHIFALDITDPLAPLRASDTATCKASNLSPTKLAQARTVLWENGDPLDPNEFRPEQTATGVQWDAPTVNPKLYADDVAHEGPGFPGGGMAVYPSGSPLRVNHYLGESAQVFMGQLLGAGTHQDITYVAAQNYQTDGYGRPITYPATIPCVGGACNPKDYSNLAAAGTTFGPQGEVVYAFKAASGVPLSQTNNIGGTLTNIIEHYTELYFTKGAFGAGAEGYRSGGNNDIPAPPLGVSLSGRPDTELVVVPDLDSQVWGLLPGTLAPYRSLLVGGVPEAFPLFDLQRYAGGPKGNLYTCAAPVAPGVLSAQGGALVQQAAFANPASVVAPGTCASVQDPVVLLATGGVDWGPAASVLVALDLAPTNNAISACTNALTCPAAALANDSAASPLPVQDGTFCKPLEVATCPSGVADTSAACVGRVFGQPLVAGQDVLYATSTGSLTGVGADVSAQQGDGRIQALGSGACNAGTIKSGAGVAASGNNNDCGICANSEQSNDLALHVGKVASGLAASSPNAAGQTSIFSASTTGLSELTITVTKAVQQAYQKILLQQWWMRKQERTQK